MDSRERFVFIKGFVFVDVFKSKKKKFDLSEKKSLIGRKKSLI
jgi:hypothetical protein